MINTLTLKISLLRSKFLLTAHIDLALNGITIITGPSGSGKSSLLRCIAGLEEKCEGEMMFNQMVWQNSNKNIFIDTHQRKIGFVFQENHLFRHLNVFQNIFYAEKRRHNKINEISKDEIIDQLNISHLLNKKTDELSGGEKQKVAIARTLVNSPDLILMDEPLSSIDLKAKNEIMIFLNQIKKNLKIPIIFVTHSEEEKNFLGDHCLSMDNGNLKKTNEIALPKDHSLETEIECYKKYQKQIILDEFGIYGQKKLKETKFLCVGAGGLASPVCLYLAAAGVGSIGIVDHDKIELSNLQRQILYQYSLIGKNKSHEASKKMREINPTLNVEIFNTKINSKNAENIITNYDIIIDCTDHFSSNFLLSDLSFKYDKPLIYASVSGFEGQLSTFIPNQSACFRCLFKKYPENDSSNCNTVGILGPICGVIGSMQALQAIYAALGVAHCKKYGLNIFLNQFLKVDMKNSEMSSFSFKKDKSCILCSKNKNEIKIFDYINNCESNLNSIELSFHEIENKNEYLFIDVREKIEYQCSHIKGAINIPLSDLIKNTRPIPIKNDKAIVVYCQGERRSKKAIEILNHMGFDKIIKLKGGYEKLIEDNFNH